MALSSASVFRLGIFVFLAFIVFFVGIISLGDRKGWFDETTVINARFTDINGLETGAPVRISGINAGKILSILPPRKLGDQVTVEMEISRKFDPLLRTDSRARIETEGLVGYKLIIVEPGTDSAPPVERNGMIQSLEPVKFADITRQFYDASSDIASIVKTIDAIADSVRKGKGTLGKLVKDESLYRNLSSAAVSVDSAFNAFNDQSRKIAEIVSQVSVSVSEIMDKINRGEGTVGKLVSSDSLYADIRTSTTEFIDVVKKLEDGVFAFSENMEALKRNWFFKGYFEDRGYWSREEFTRIDESLTLRRLELEEMKNALSQKLLDIEKREAALRKAEEEAARRK